MILLIFHQGFKHLIALLEREGEFYKKLAPSASTSAAALGVLSVATNIMRKAKNHVNEHQLASLVNAQIGYETHFNERSSSLRSIRRHRVEYREVGRRQFYNLVVDDCVQLSMH